MGKYIAEAWSVTSTSGRTYSVKKDLGHVGSTGYIVSEGGTVYVQIAEVGESAKAQMKIQLDNGEVLPFDRIDGWKITKVEISTESATAVSGRLFLR